jgi:fermentation-respiration switch protein FrsA (DUF1100 family)
MVYVKQFLLILFLVSVVTTQNLFAMRPSAKYDKLPSDYKLQYDSLNITTADNARLTGWLCKPAQVKNDSVLIIMASSDGGNMSGNLPMVDGLVKNLGVPVLMFDYRGYGTSDKIVIDTDMLAMTEFTIDIFQAVQWAIRDSRTKGKKIVIYGRSMGASLAIVVSGVFGGVDGIISESPYVTQQGLTDMVSQRNKQTTSKRQIGFIKSSLLEPMELASRCSAKLLLMHGQNEDLISTDDIYKLYTAYKSPFKSLWIAADTRHLEIPYKETALFVTAVYTFISSL